MLVRNIRKGKKTYHKRLHGHLPWCHLQIIPVTTSLFVNRLHLHHRLPMIRVFLHRRTMASWIVSANLELLLEKEPMYGPAAANINKENLFAMLERRSGFVIGTLLRDGRWWHWCFDGGSRTRRRGKGPRGEGSGNRRQDGPVVANRIRRSQNCVERSQNRFSSRRMKRKSCAQDEGWRATPLAKPGEWETCDNDSGNLASCIAILLKGSIRC
jgi:hypothetical protein